MTGRSPGSRVTTGRVAFPEHKLQWTKTRRLTGHSCGGSIGVEPISLFIPCGTPFTPGPVSAARHGGNRAGGPVQNLDPDHGAEPARRRIVTAS